MSVALFPLARVRVGWRTAIAPEWTFDLDALEHAARELGVQGEIEVGCAEYANGRWTGMYSHAGGTHRIRVKRAATAEQASRTLWHELTHAAQRTRTGRVQGTRRLARTDHDAYLAHPREQEARANEANHERMPLTKEG